MRPRSAKDGVLVDGSSETLLLPRRLTREQRTVEVMVRMYCRDHHSRGAGSGVTRVSLKKELCPACASLVEYSNRRVAKCRYEELKPTCARCTTHCFRRSEREQIRAVMRYAGPRMTLRHPYLAVLHLLDRRCTPSWGC
jgi:hypothetical protein